MSRLPLIILVVALGAGGWYLWTNYTIDVHRGPQGGLEYVKLVPRAAGGLTPAEHPADQPPAAAGRSFIRIATFDVEGLDESKLASHQVGDVLVRVLPHFDVIALQGIHAKGRGLLVRLVEQINATGRFYDFASSPTADRDGLEHYNAFLFDRTSIEIDRSTVQFDRGPGGPVPPQAAGGRVSRARSAREGSLHLRPDQRANRSQIARRRNWTCWPPCSAPCAIPC